MKTKCNKAELREDHYLLSATELSSFENFKRFVKSLNGNDLGSLLQFLTEGNIICDTIAATFTKVEALLLVLLSQLVYLL